MKIHFSIKGRIVGATVQKYLIEKTRIVGQIDGERNFHIFYQLIRGLSAEERVSLNVLNFSEKYSFLSDSDSIIPHVDDANDFFHTKTCLRSVGIDNDLQHHMFQLLIGILHLGNIDFENDDSEGQVGPVTEQSLKDFELTSQMLGVDPSEFNFAMKKQNMFVDKATIVKIQSKEQVPCNYLGCEHYRNCVLLFRHRTREIRLPRVSM